MDPGVIAVCIPFAIVMIPIVGILTRHQQKMAEIVHRGGGGSGANEEIAKLRQEMSELKTLVHSQAILLDNVASTNKALNAPPPAPSISERLSS